VAAREAARRDLLELKSELRLSHGVLEGEHYELFLLEGEVTQSLLDFAHQKDIDLIVVGTHGRSGLGKMLMGSVAERVFRQSPVPVLTVGPQLHAQTRGLPPRNILVPADFSPASDRASRYACALAKEHNAKLTLLHVLDPGNYKYEGDRRRALPEIEKKLMQPISASAGSLKPCCRTELGRVVPTILQVAAETRADLLVMGVRPWTGLLDRLMWPHAYAVVRDAPCPVVTVRGAVSERT
jgi:nucleotide-binding universal stress UspA family protein